MNLTASQKLVCERIVNVFETGSVRGDYGNISIFNDGPGKIRQITYGRSQTTEYGNLRELVEMYVAAKGKYSESLRQYASIIGNTALVDNATFKSLLQKAGREDPVMEQTQDAFFEKRYFKPALDWATQNGFTQALSMLVIYDSFIHSGSILGFLRSRFSENVPSSGGDEKTWISEYVNVRQNWLATHSMTILRGTVYRTQCFLREIAKGNWDLTQLPISAHGVLVDDGLIKEVLPSEDIKWIQSTLNGLGFNLTVDGYEGTQTHAAICQFQTDHNLLADGIVGTATRSAMEAALKAPVASTGILSTIINFITNLFSSSTTPSTTSTVQGSSTMSTWLSNLFLSFLGNTQVQSIVPSVLKVVGGALLAKFGVDAATAGSVLTSFLDLFGGVATVSAGLFYSAQNASPYIANPVVINPSAEKKEPELKSTTGKPITVEEIPAVSAGYSTTASTTTFKPSA